MAALIPGARSLSEPLGGSVVTLGSFDGVHRGHQTLIGRAVAEARRLGVPAVGYTFDPHPASVLAPDRAPATLMGIEERAYTMGRYGLDYVLIECFDAEFARVTADGFVDRYLVEALQPRHVVVGFNFTYGRGRGGDPEHLVAAGARHGFGVEVVEAVELEGAVASSTAVRAHLRAGNLDAVRGLLGRDFALTGVVVRGDQRGRQLGFPTANLALEGSLVPACGVYATEIDLLDAAGEATATYPGMTNVGRRPTFEGRAVTAEAHLFDFEGDLYGRRLRVHLRARLRDERRFDGPDALRAQLRADAAAARAALNRT